MSRTVAAAGLLTLALTGCAGAAPDSSTPAPPSSLPAQQGAVTGKVVVLAAASLTAAFRQIARDVEATHPGLRVDLNLAGSSSLAQQVVAGAPADVFAAASPATMKTVVDAGDALGSPAVFARNTLEIAVPPGNPGRVRGLADFARPELALAVCAQQVPCGAAAVKVFAAAGVSARPDTEETDVKAVLAKVVLDEVDAGLVYRTDVTAAGGKVVGVPFPQASAAVNDYPLVALRGAPNPAGARLFVDAVRSVAGQRALRTAGFMPP